MNLINDFHEKAVHSRRVQALNDLLKPLVCNSKSVLDVGCGDGLLASLLSASLAETKFSGIDVLVREQTLIQVEHFDGQIIPFADDSFDSVMMVDVLHHTEDASILLREAKRVAKKHIVLKDHTRNGLLAGPTLRFMDYIGNAHHGVALPYNYLAKAQWDALFEKLELEVEHWNGRPRMYGFPADWLFGRSLQFVARLLV